MFGKRSQHLLLATTLASLCVASAIAVEPMWYQSIVNGRNALSQNNYASSQKHYQAALQELEKIATTMPPLTKAAPPAMSDQQKQALANLYVELPESFRQESIEKGLNDIEAMRRETKKKVRINTLDFPDFPDFPDFQDFQRNLSDLEKQSKDLDAQKTAKDAQDKATAHRDIELQRRILAVYKVLLGPNNHITRLCKQNFEEDLDRYNHDMGVVPKDVLFAEQAKRKLEAKWHEADWKATQAASNRDYSGAANLQYEAIKEAQKLGAKSLRLAESLSNLAAIERINLKKPKEAEVHYKQALADYERILGKNDTKVWETLFNLKGVYADLKEKPQQDAIEKRMAELEK